MTKKYGWTEVIRLKSVFKTMFYFGKRDQKMSMTR